MNARNKKFHERLAANRSLSKNMECAGYRPAVCGLRVTRHGQQMSLMKINGNTNEVHLTQMKMHEARTLSTILQKLSLVTS